MYGQKKYALVIGNSEYSGNYVRLENPSNDAKTMQAVFKRLGFETTVLRDGDRKNMEEYIEEFVKKLDSNDVAVFYFSGHGHYYSDYYLIPSGTYNNKEISSCGISLKDIAKEFCGRTRFSFFFIDACRNKVGGSDGSQIGGITRSLVSTDDITPPSSNDTSVKVICYATENGAKAYDGEGDLSPFTKALSECLFDTTEFSVTWTKIKEAVNSTTKGKQIPSMDKRNYTGKYYFNKNGSYIPLNKKTVKFDLHPANSSIILTNGKTKENIKASSGETKILNVGESYDYSIVCDGYIPVEGKLEIKDNCAYTFEVSLKKAEKSALKVNCENATADVYLDNKYVGKTPCKVNTLTGPHEILLEAKMMESSRKRIFINTVYETYSDKLSRKTIEYFDWDRSCDNGHYGSYHFSPKYQFMLEYMYRVSRMSYGLILGLSPGVFKFNPSVQVNQSVDMDISVGTGGNAARDEIVTNRYNSASLDYSELVDPYGIAKYYDSNIMALANVGVDACNGIMFEAGVGAAWHRDKYYMSDTYKITETKKEDGTIDYQYASMDKSHVYMGETICSPAIRLGATFMIPFNRYYDMGLTIGGGYTYLPMNHKCSSWDATIGFVYCY